MNKNPINLAVRFLLEIIMLIVLGYWGWHLNESWVHYILAVGLPLSAAALWGIFRIADDPRPAPVEIPGMLRLLLEWILFGFAVWALHDLGHTLLSWIMAVILVLHYIVSYDRTWVMLRNEPYKGFSKK
ncbi:YrdB family protein [Flavitalea flava]